jgi:hypothetical protein
MWMELGKKHSSTRLTWLPKLSKFWFSNKSSLKRSTDYLSTDNKLFFYQSSYAAKFLDDCPETELWNSRIVKKVPKT